MNYFDKTKEEYNKEKDLKYPKELEVSNWWKQRIKRMRNDIPRLPSPEMAVNWGQTQYSFDHRRKYNETLINEKIKELEKQFTNLPYLTYESLVSVKSSFNGKGSYSNIFLWHLNFYLRCTQYCNPTSVLEIGSGYGGLARIFGLMKSNIKYTLLDFPESLFFAKNYLNHDCQMHKYNFIPVQKIKTLYNNNYDLVINTGSFQEMTDTTIKYYMDFIQNKINTKYLYSCNYPSKLNSKESIATDPLILIDNKWTVIYEAINPKILTLDSDRDWREIFLERIYADK